MRGKKLESKDIENVKAMLEAGLSRDKITDITGFSISTIYRIEAGNYDQVNAVTPNDYDVEALVNKNCAYIGEAVYVAVHELKKMQEQLEEISSAVKYLAKQESLRQELKEGKKKVVSAVLTDDKWKEILKRVGHYGDQLTVTYLKESSARWDGSILLIDCKQPDRDYLSRNKDAVNRIKVQAQYVLGVPVTVKW